MLADLIASEVFPVVCLQKIFRQAQESDIVVNAHRINKGEQIALTNKKQGFLFSGEEQCPCYLQAYGAADWRDAAEICKGFTVRYPGADADAERQPWCGDVKRRTAELFKSSVGGQKGGSAGRYPVPRGDKVMQIKNNYQLEWEVVSRYDIPIDKELEF